AEATKVNHGHLLVASLMRGHERPDYIDGDGFMIKDARDIVLFLHEFRRATGCKWCRADLMLRGVPMGYYNYSRWAYELFLTQKNKEGVLYACLNMNNPYVQNEIKHLPEP